MYNDESERCQALNIAKKTLDNLRQVKKEASENAGVLRVILTY